MLDEKQTVIHGIVETELLKKTVIECGKFYVVYSP